MISQSGFDLHFFFFSNNFTESYFAYHITHPFQMYRSFFFFPVNFPSWFCICFVRRLNFLLYFSYFFLVWTVSSYSLSVFFKSKYRILLYRISCLVASSFSKFVICFYFVHRVWDKSKSFLLSWWWTVYGGFKGRYVG